MLGAWSPFLVKYDSYVKMRVDIIICYELARKFKYLSLTALRKGGLFESSFPKITRFS